MGLFEGMQGLINTRAHRTHVVIAAAAQDEQAALRLWKALKKHGVECSINDAHVFQGPSVILITVLSAASVDSLELTGQIMAYRDGGGRTILAARRDPHAVTPPSLAALRGDDGWLERAAAPRDLGVLDEDDTSARRMAATVAAMTSSPISDGVRRHGLAAAAALLVVVSAGAAGWSHLEARTDIAEVQVEAELADDLLAALADGFPVNPSGETVLGLADRLEGVLVERGLDAWGEDSLMQQAQLFHAIGEARDLHGEPERAQAAFARAHDLTGAVLARSQNDAERIFAHSQSAFWAGNSAFRRGDLDIAAGYFDTYADLSARLVALDPDNSLYQAELGYAANNNGALAFQSGDVERALAEFESALSIFQGAPLEDGHVGPVDVANIHGWRANALYGLGRFETAAQERRIEADIYQTQLQARPDDVRLSARWANAVLRQAEALSANGRTDEADAVLEPAVVAADRLVSDHPDNIRYARLYLGVLRERARLALWRDDLIRAQILLREARSHITRVDAAGQQDDRHGDRGLNHLLAAQIALSAGAVDTARLEATDAVLAGEHALREGYGLARGLLASAYFVEAEARRLSGDDIASNRSLREALTHLDHLEDGATNPVWADLRSRVLWRMGEVASARSLRAGLDLAGYNRPDYLEFWRGVDSSFNVDAADQAQGEDRG
jgi:tetratricopeptide (TPR) repeat protein